MLRLADSMLALHSQAAKGGGQVRDGVEEEVGFGGAEAGLCGERAEDGDGANSGAAGHLEIFRGIAHVNAGGGIQGHLAQSETQRGRMRLAVTCVSAADMRGEEIGEFEEAQLADDAIAIAAGDYSELVARPEMLEHAADAGD